MFTSHSVGTWFRLSAGKKSLGSAMSERESAGEEKRELLLESSSRYEESCEGKHGSERSRDKETRELLSHPSSAREFSFLPIK